MLRTGTKTPTGTKYEYLVPGDWCLNSPGAHYAYQLYLIDIVDEYDFF